MIKINDLVRVIDKELDVDDLDTEIIDIFAGEEAKVIKIINDKVVEIEFLDKEIQRLSNEEKATITLIEDIEKI